MEKWEYRTLYLSLETWQRDREKYEDYVVTYNDGARLEGLEMIMRRYLDDGGWELVSTNRVQAPPRRTESHRRYIDRDLQKKIFIVTITFSLSPPGPNYSL